LILHWKLGAIGNQHMDAKQLADRFAQKIAEAVTERGKQTVLASENEVKRTDDVEHCHRALEQNVLPFFAELKHHMGEQFSYAQQIDRDHKPVGVSFKLGDGGPVNITTAFGNIVITRMGSSGAALGGAIVLAPDAEPYISNSGDLTREKMAKLVEMVMENADR
jgi:hypothetical protein